MPVASLWASPDYKSVANCPIMVSRILYLTKLISEIKRDTSVNSRLYWANILLTTIFTIKYKMFHKFSDKTILNLPTINIDTVIL